jgi:dephospho-CoA kinase
VTEEPDRAPGGGGSPARDRGPRAASGEVDPTNSRSPRPRRTLRLGLTGPIGCGKSTVAGWLAEHGAVIVDADRIAREVVEPGEPALAEVVAQFGPGVLRDGALDRTAMAAIAFADPAALRRLEAIVRPAVRPRIHARIAEAEAAAAPMVVLEAIGLVDGGYVGECDEVWLVSCDPAEQASRIRARGLTPVDAAQRIAAQREPLARILEVATRVIDTSGTVAEARARVETVLAEVLASFEDSAAPADAPAGA